jgi:DNA-binding IclR family transcriptional regulator
METTTSVEKAIDVLFHLRGASEPCGVTAIGSALGLPKSSVHRLLSALGRRGLVARDAQGRYRLGLGLVSLGLDAFERQPVVSAARPELEAAARELSETVFLVQRSAGALTVMDQVEGQCVLRAAPRIGSAVPVHATAVGKLFLAYGEIPWPEGRWERFTTRTRAERGELESEVKRAREVGFAEAEGEWVEGLSVSAAPIVVDRHLLGCIATAAASIRMRGTHALAVRQITISAARNTVVRLNGERHESLD